ncbi:hypothetical protein WR25_23171 isoform A [Diploscapter pachys]|uniref:DUF7596 domain-containing protein n=1 Tax=Diploscapter pachys TaxID=2018661 RepID=A0A2A2LZX0_9BILA|nr:hypothetical protein WR25_23171 isoform A [Diploscapter pachys]
MSLVESFPKLPFSIEGLYKEAKASDLHGHPLASHAIIPYSATQGYCILLPVHTSLKGKYVKITHPTSEQPEIQVVSVQDEKENRTLLPIVERFHTAPEARPVECHLNHILSEKALGRFNLELKKNLTMDTFEESDTWRDDAGFLVTDRNTFFLYKFDTSKLLKTLLPAEGVTIEECSKDHLDALGDFDNSFTGLRRDTLLEILLENSQILAATNGETVDGFIVGQKTGRILAIYAETVEIAHSLLKAYIEKNKLKSVELFAVKGVWECEPESQKKVNRRHTRSVPGQLKWSKIYALNMGVHIV